MRSSRRVAVLAAFVALLVGGWAAVASAQTVVPETRGAQAAHAPQDHGKAHAKARHAAHAAQPAPEQGKAAVRRDTSKTGESKHARAHPAKGHRTANGHRTDHGKHATPTPSTPAPATSPPSSSGPTSPQPTPSQPQPQPTRHAQPAPPSPTSGAAPPAGQFRPRPHAAAEATRQVPSPARSSAAKPPPAAAQPQAPIPFLSSLPPAMTTPLGLVTLGFAVMIAVAGSGLLMLTRRRAG